MNRMTTYEAAFLGLLHDIGKFYQRTMLDSRLSEKDYEWTYIPNLGYPNHLHAAYTGRFFRQFLDLSVDYEMLSAGHHLLDESNIDHEIIRNADCIASSIDREDEDNDIKSSSKRFITKRLDNIFNDVDLGEYISENYCFPLTCLSDFKLEDINCKIRECAEEESNAAANEYKFLFDKFVAEIPKYKEITSYTFNKMYARIKDYTSFIPASSYKVEACTVSLFDHLKLTSAISSCLVGCEWEDLERAKFYILEFDLSGIQKFIYRITEGSENKSGIAKSLRGRSMYVSLITKLIAYAILGEFKLTCSNILYTTGGGAVLLLPNRNDSEQIINDICIKIQQELFNNFALDINFIYAYDTITKNELTNYKSEKSALLKSKLTQEKFHRCSKIKMIKKFNQVNSKICPMCESNITDGNMCLVCQKTLELGEIITKVDSCYVAFDYENEIKPNECLFNLSFNFGSVFLLDKEVDCEYIESINSSSIGDWHYSANLVPKRNDRIISFEEMFDYEEEGTHKPGVEKIAILKMDVDNMAGIFGFGLTNANNEATHSISKQLTLSRQLDYFFTKLLVDICKETSYSLGYEDNIFYINYAGGDDLVIIGPAIDIIYLVKDIEAYFNKYTSNAAITISAGIHVQSAKQPIRKGIKIADNLLDCSKEKPTKHSIALFDNQVISFDKYNCVLSKSEMIATWIEEKRISRSFVHRVMEASSNYEYYMKSIPILTYSLFNTNKKIDKSLMATIRQEFMLNGLYSKEDIDNLNIELKIALLMTK